MDDFFFLGDSPGDMGNMGGQAQDYVPGDGAEGAYVCFGVEQMLCEGQRLIRVWTTRNPTNLIIYFPIYVVSHY